MPKTIADMVELTGKRVRGKHLDRDAEIPLVTVAGAQGDVLVVRVDDEELRDSGDAVDGGPVESEVSPNTHSLHPNGPAFWRADDRDEFSDELMGCWWVFDGAGGVGGVSESRGARVGFWWVRGRLRSVVRVRAAGRGLECSGGSEPVWPGR